jgi:ABC-2 type transport system ATP-binding protein
MNQKEKLAIEIKNLSKTYKNGVKALSDINLQISSGEFFALLGANGAGKTTIIGILTDLVRKTSGQVIINGTDIDKDFSTAKSYIGIVPQEFNFNIFEKVLDIVVNQAGYYGIPRDEAMPKAIQILEKLGLGDKLKVQSRTLSGGMKRRLMIARALIHDPEILILDEPTAGVDVELRNGMWEYLRQINQENQVTIVLTTHYLEEVEQLCDRAAIIKKGEIVRLDTVKNLISSMNQEEYVIDLKETVTVTDTQALKNNLEIPITIADNNTLHAILKKEQTLNQLINFLSQQNIVISGIRPKGNRLEALFLDTINN